MTVTGLQSEICHLRRKPFGPYCGFLLNNTHGNREILLIMYTVLDDLTIVEGASFIAAPSCALHFAQMGAKVIRFDMIGGGPDYRRWPLGGTGNSFYWEGLNKGKRSIAINLASAEGRELAIQLATAPGEGRGLFVTNFPVGSFLSHENLVSRRSDIISLRVLGWPDGRNAVDYTINAAVGVPFMTGPEDLAPDVPVNSALPAWDLLTGAYGAFSLLAAERRRRTTGQGAEIRLSLSDLAIGSLANLGQVAEVTAGNDRARLGNSLFGALGCDFRTNDNRGVMIVAITPRQWTGLLKAIGISEEIEALENELGVSFDRDEGIRFKYRDHLVPKISAAIGRFSFREISKILDDANVCWEPYQSLKQAVEQDTRLVKENDLFRAVTHADQNTYPTPSALGRWHSEREHEPVGAPKLGQHTEEILAEHLGLSETEIAKLHDAGTVASAS